MEFIDLKEQYRNLKEKIDNNIQKVIQNADFISGPEVKELEEQLAEYVGRKYCATCANGTDALTIANTRSSVLKQMMQYLYQVLHFILQQKLFL